MDEQTTFQPTANKLVDQVREILRSMGSGLHCALRQIPNPQKQPLQSYHS